MNKQTRQRIKESVMAALKQGRAMPEHAIPIYTPSEGSANSITQTVIKFLKAEGWQAERISTTGRYIQGERYTDVLGHTREMKGQWIPGTSTRGSADISATIRGRSVKIEVKYGRDKQSEHQREYQEAIERAGGVYWLVRDLDGFLEQYDRI